MKNKILIALIILCSGSSASMAQKDNSTTFGLSLTPYFYAYSNLSAINNSLKLYNYPLIKSYGPAFSFGVIFGDTSDAVYEEIEGGATSAEGKSNNMIVSLTEAQSMISFTCNLNYSSTNKRKILTGPVIGFGVSNAKLDITDKSEAPITFDSSLASLKGQREITSNLAFLIRLGWSAEKSISKRHNCFIGLKAGYDIDINHPKWQFNYSNLADNPKTNLSGFYAGLKLRLVLGQI